MYLINNIFALVRDLPYMGKVSVRKTEKYFLFILFFIVLAKGVIMIDPDFGWRLRTGFYILENSVPKTDLYTYTMPSFPWVDHAWLSDVVISGIYGISGKVGLGILLALIFLTTIYLISKPLLTKVDKTQKGKLLVEISFSKFLNPVILFTSAILLPFASVRVQVVTWLFLAILVKIIFDKKLWLRLGVFMPLFFLLWTNLHGGFISGLTVLWLVVVARLLKRESSLKDLLITVISTLATFINPYGEGVYREIWSSISDNRLRFEIIEWRPAFMTFDIPTIALFSLSVIFVFYYRKRFTIETIMVYLLLLVQGIASIRHLPLWAIMATPVTLQALSYFYSEVAKDKLSLARFNNMFKYVFVFAFVTFLLQTWFSIKGANYLSENKFYPREAVSYLKNNPTEGETFSEYGWGGYLIWKLPEKKVFIDGRMPSWKSDTEYSSESDDAMKEYLTVMKGKEDYKPIFEKYSVKTVLWPVKKEKSRLDKFEDKMSEKFNYIYKALGFSDKKFYLTDKLLEDGWTIVYEDKKSMILVKK